MPAATRARIAWFPTRRAAWPDLILGGLLTLATLVVHDVGYMFSAPFWNDEAWVAISTALPLHQIASVSASTPVGWSLLLRLVFAGGEERLRLIPLLFSAATVAAAYLFVRSLPWPRLAVARMTAVLAGLAALLTPSALARDDLKQYTADAFVALVVWWLVGRVETDGSRRRLITLGVVAVVGFLFSAVGVFLGAAAFGILLIVALVRRRWADLRSIAVVGAASGVLLGLVFLLLYRPGIPPGLNNYWAGFYLPISNGWGASWSYLTLHAELMAGYLGAGPLWIALVLVLAGVITLFRLRRPAVAGLVPALLAEMILLGAIKQYPLFDMRTSHFLTVVLAVTAAIGVGGICTLLSRVHLSAAAVAAVLAAVLFVTGSGVRAGIRSHPIPDEDPRSPTRYIAAHRGPDDIVVISMLSSWGFAYYWTTAPGGGGSPATEHVTANLQQFVTVFPDEPHILVATDRTPAAVDSVMTLAAAAAARIGPNARIWVMHVHVIPTERTAYDVAAFAHGYTAQSMLGGTLELLTR